ncbi:hypothetical protein ADUPG1_003811 [Aduncisulcus paluster]|uniref:Uncharacterized protein n=1 Tax=Aduncisulcus paluster TaxID=2918883 RepID=A0ABQ5L1N0_9EUKA|nr:hypothetical protein ADUPG1_003811 [Aduncisulcus paluster]
MPQDNDHDISPENAIAILETTAGTPEYVAARKDLDPALSNVTYRIFQRGLNPQTGEFYLDMGHVDDVMRTRDMIYSGV